MPHCLKTGISAYRGLWKASAEEMPCYSTPYILPAEREGEREGGETDREGGRERKRAMEGGVGSWPYRIQCKKFDFHRLFKGIYAIGSVETPGLMGFHNLSNL